MRESEIRRNRMKREIAAIENLEGILRKYHETTSKVDEIRDRQHEHSRAYRSHTECSEAEYSEYCRLGEALSSEMHVVSSALKTSRRQLRDASMRVYGHFERFAD